MTVRSRLVTIRAKQPYGGFSWNRSAQAPGRVASWLCLLRLYAACET
jgi:hypothetical protein